MGKYEIEVIFGNNDFRKGIRYYIDDNGNVVINEERENVDLIITANGYTSDEELEDTIITKSIEAIGNDPINMGKSYAKSHAYVYYYGELKAIYVMEDLLYKDRKIQRYDCDSFYKMQNIGEDRIKEGKKRYAIISINRLHKSLALKSLKYGCMWLFWADVFYKELNNEETLQDSVKISAVIALGILLLTVAGKGAAFLCDVLKMYIHYRKRLLELASDEKGEKLIKGIVYKNVKGKLN